MKPFRPHLSERQQVTLILVAALSALFGIWFGLLRPLVEKRAEIASLQAQLDDTPYTGLTLEALLSAASHENQGERQLQAEWEATVERLATFANQSALRRSEIGRIDYKVELFNTRVRLIRKSEALGVQLVPIDLGLDDALGGNDAEIRTRMLQLKSVEKLADLTLDRRIQRLHSIAPLAPVEHLAPDGKPSFDEYPVKAEFDVDFDNLFVLFQAVFSEGQVFAFRNLRVEAGPLPQAPLRVKATLSALLFE